ncbi:hypothetical protein ASE46_09625 [Bacillus sp. Root239]|nr:hypothetical protein ASE46_09625 [Bacillus sp. Root239]
MSVSKEKIRNKKAIRLTISKKGEPWTTRFIFLSRSYKKIYVNLNNKEGYIKKKDKMLIKLQIKKIIL